MKMQCGTIRLCHPRESVDPAGPRRAGAGWASLGRGANAANLERRVASWILAFARMTCDGAFRRIA
jgi:hypothetical protein